MVSVSSTVRDHIEPQKGNWVDLTHQNEYGVLMYKLGQITTLTALGLALMLVGCDDDELDENADERHQMLADVSHWFYHIGFEPSDETVSEMVDSSYDFVVLEPVFTDAENTDYPMAEIVDWLHGADHPKLVIAYIDIGQAEDWRVYFQDGWTVGDPEWIVGEDPDGWEGNLPVAYWHDDWHDIWLGAGGLLEQIINVGFDGIYLDWVEAYSDESVVEAAESEGVEPQQEMLWWVEDLARFGRERNPNFLVISQNAAELAALDDFATIVDAIAQEQTWFDGSAENTPPGDCPLPRTEADIETTEYEESLSPECLQMYIDYPDSTLHVSTEGYLRDLDVALDQGLVVFTIDYAVDPDNIQWVYETSRARGYVPFTSERALDVWIPPMP